MTNQTGVDIFHKGTLKHMVAMKFSQNWFFWKMSYLQMFRET